MQADPIPKVACPDGSGTAFRVGPHLLLTAKHVATHKGCTIDGQPMKVAWVSPTSDVALLSDDRSGRFLHVDCGGFVQGRTYAALGYARGLDQITRVEMVAIGEAVGVRLEGKPQSGPMGVLVGVFTSVPGQSGGPIVDAMTGDATGIVSGGNFEVAVSVSVALRDTPICKGHIA
jgi:hypothetical protein